MEYLFRINVCNEGYSLFSYKPGGKLRSLPLDDTSSDALDEFAKGQRHIDYTLDRVAGGPILYVSTWNTRCLVMNGHNVAAPDQYGRQGLTFVCGIIAHRSEVLELMDRIMVLNSPKRDLEIQKAVAGIATGTAEVAHLTNLLDDSTPRWKPPRKPAEPSKTATAPIAGIVHDVSAPELAWRAMIVSHQGLKQSWKVFDVVDKEKVNAVVTKSSANNHGTWIPLSDYMRFAVSVANAQFGNDAAAAPSQRPSAETEDARPPHQEPRWRQPWPWVASSILMAATSAVLAFCLLLILLSGVVTRG